MSVVNFRAERARLRPFRWQSDRWLAACIAAARTQPRWQPALPELHAEVRRRRIRATGGGAPAGATVAERDVLPPNAAQRGASGPEVNSSQGMDYCGADGGEHDWSVWYWLGGERDECGEHVVCRKCREEYAP